MYEKLKGGDTGAEAIADDGAEDAGVKGLQRFMKRELGEDSEVKTHHDLPERRRAKKKVAEAETVWRGKDEYWEEHSREVD